MSMLEEESVNSIRESSRCLLNIKRRTLREVCTDQNRSLVIPSTSSEHIIQVINKLKTKARMSVAELNLLKSELLNDEKYVDTVTNTHMALRGLVKKLEPGNDIKIQCEAAGCLCNMSLGESAGCVIIAKAAGPYLVTALDSASIPLTTLSVWCLGNLFGSGKRACAVLKYQGVIAKLLTMLDHTGDYRATTALYALKHYVKTMQNQISIDGYLEHILNLPLQETSECLFLLSCHRQFITTLEQNSCLLNKLIDSINDEIHNMVYNNNIIFIIRILANICSNTVMTDIVLSKLSYDVLFEFIAMFDVNCLSVGLRDSICWLLGNVFVFSTDSEAKVCFFDQVVSDLCYFVTYVNIGDGLNSGLTEVE